jgi:glycosyltransferase involved in cell wall biosynthesis
MRALQVFHALFLLPFILLKNRIRVIQVTGTIETLLLPVSRLLGCTAISVRHLVPNPGKAGWVGKLRSFAIESVYRFGTLFANHVICVSEAVAREIRKISPSDRVIVIPNWVPSLPPRRARNGIRNPLQILFIGRLEPHKGLHLLLRALQNMSGYRLTVLGEGSELIQLRALADKENVLFCGFVDDPSSYYRNADIFVMPSLGPEGLPLVTIEAMSYGLPCLLSDLPVHEEVSCRGSAALLFESGNADSLRAKLSILINSELERMRFGDAAYQAVLQRYCPQAAAPAYLKAYGLVESRD